MTYEAACEAIARILIDEGVETESARADVTYKILEALGFR